MTLSLFPFLPTLARGTVIVPDNLDMARTAGPVLLGYMFNWGLFGALSVQVYWYALLFPGERRWIKALVYGVYCVELAQTIIVTHDAFASFARGFGDPAAVVSMQTEWFAEPVLTGVVSCVVQIYYAYRVYALSKSKYLGGFIILLAVMQVVAAICAGVGAYIVGDWLQLPSKPFMNKSVSIWLAGSAVCDIIIAVAMTILLVRKDSGIPETHALIVRLVHLVIETGALTATTATVDLILFLVFPHDAFHACAALTLGKLYSNSLMVLFNSRTHLREDSSAIALDKTTFGGRHQGGPVQTPVGFRTDAVAAEIRIERETWVADDNSGTHDQGSYDGTRKKLGRLTEEP